MKQCQRCLKQISDEGVHTCTPTALVRNLEAELSATKEKLESANNDTATVLRSLRYCIGIAERGTGRCLQDDETAEAFLLDYVKSLEKRIRESQEQEPVGMFPVKPKGAECSGTFMPCYTVPPIPPELAELKRENAELRKQLEAGIAQNKELWNLNAELQKKIESLNDLHH